MSSGALDLQELFQETTAASKHLWPSVPVVLHHSAVSWASAVADNLVQDPQH